MFDMVGFGAAGPPLNSVNKDRTSLMSVIISGTAAVRDEMASPIFVVTHARNGDDARIAD